MRMAYQDSSNNDVTWNFIFYPVLFALMSHFACAFAMWPKKVANQLVRWPGSIQTTSISAFAATVRLGLRCDKPLRWMLVARCFWPLRAGNLQSLQSDCDFVFFWEKKEGNLCKWQYLDVSLNYLKPLDLRHCQVTPSFLGACPEAVGLKAGRVWTLNMSFFFRSSELVETN